jgi:ribosomal-protein-alanine N-acetyltransferase
MNKFLEGEKVILRPLVETDITDTYLSWLNDEEVTMYMESGVFQNNMTGLKSFYDCISKSKNDVMFAIMAGKKHIGNIKLGSINWVHRFADLGIMIGDKESWGKGYGTEACSLLVNYAFKKLNLHKVWLGVYANHEKAIQAYITAGFKIEGRMEKMYNFNGNYVDKVLMGITKEE